METQNISGQSANSRSNRSSSSSSISCDSQYKVLSPCCLRANTQS